MPEFATLKPSIPKDLRHFGHGIWNKLQNAATASSQRGYAAGDHAYMER